MLEKQKRHNVKLYNLWTRQRPQVPDCIINISSTKLSISEQSALQFGLNHHILPKRIDPLSTRANIDSQITTMCKKNNINLSFDGKNNIREATDCFIFEAKKLCDSRRNQFIHKTLLNLSKNKNLKICRMDKGVGVVLLDKNTYFDKMDSIIGDASRFSKIDYNINTKSIAICKTAPWILKENSVIYYCSRYIKPLVDETTYLKIYPTGSQPGRIYGTAKHHKSNCPMRPVLSAIGTPEYSLAKWLEQRLKPYLDNKFSVTSSKTFVDEISQMKPNCTDLCVSFDIKSLYTNVPLAEVIDDIISTVYSESASSTYFAQSGIKPEILKKMLILCSESIFLYKDEVYKQCDGVAMGSPLAPLLADWFVTKIENNILLNNHHVAYKPSYYRRYVDDIFAVFSSGTARDAFFETLNEAHQNLSFTMETTSGPLPFLDTQITIKEQGFQIEVYRKPTNTDVVMNYESSAPMKWKKALISCLLTRAYNISSTFSLFTTEVEKIKAIFGKNSYPSSMVNQCVDTFISKRNITNEKFKVREGMKDDINDHQSTSPDEKKAYATVPYVGKPSLKFQRRIREEMSRQGLTILASFTTTKVSSYFNLKSTCSPLFKANVVYRFTCSRDENCSYIGETTRQLFRRIIEHSKPSKKFSAIFQHIEQCRDCQNATNIGDNFNIMQHCTARTVTSHESLMISKFRPNLNTQLGPGNGRMISLALYT